MYLYSNILGTFVFNQNYKIREKVLFSDNDTIKNFELLEKGEVLESEKKFLKKFKNIQNLREEKDASSLSKIYKELEPFRDEFYKKNIILTKTQIKKSVTDDLLIIQVSSSIKELDKSINLLSKRLREWYSYVLPEVEDMIDDHKNFAERITKQSTEQLKKDFKIKQTMGADLKKEELNAIKSLGSAILDLYRQKENKEKHLEKLMKKTCPNMTAVAGYKIGAKLLSIAGSLKKIVLMPSSTVQLLGAEKALFRHMITKAKAPKHGVIIDHPILQKAPRQDKGKAARAIADKISIAVKVDYFKGKFVGDKLRKELEDRFR